ncbi:hypothetical protein KIPB_012974, partial [Kipferlia bialata]
VDLQVTVVATQVGPFRQIARWRVDGSSEPLTLEIRGKVLPPSIRMSQDYLSFGDCPFGFATTREVTVTNDSPVQVSLSLGIGQAPPDEERDRDRARRGIVKGSGGGGGADFQIRPDTCTLEPGQSQSLSVTLVPSLGIGDLGPSDLCLNVLIPRINHLAQATPID